MWTFSFLHTTWGILREHHYTEDNPEDVFHAKTCGVYASKISLCQQQRLPPIRSPNQTSHHLE